MSRTAPRHRGFTLLEVMISLAILLVGLLGMMRLQIWGLNSNQGARAEMIATQLAREVATALDQLPFNDPRLALTARPAGTLLEPDGSLAGGGYTAFAGLPGVRGDDRIEQGGDGLVYRRGWTVQALGNGARVVAVSVVFRERGNPRLREVVVYLSKVEGVGFLSNIGAYN